MTGFRLYPHERHWFSFNDYAAVVATVRRLGARTVLEFGPGSSTLALLEGGSMVIDTCEDDPEWLPPSRDLFRDHPSVILRPYAWRDPLSIQVIDPVRYDFCFIDGPADNAKRPACIEYALDRCDAVMVALECADGSDFLSNACRHLAEKHGRAVEIMETGPLAGAFAVLT